MKRQTILFVVHPGSACGSADFNLGIQDAEAARGRLREAVDRWVGGVVVIDGFLSDELRQPRYGALGAAIAGLLDRSFAAGLPAMRTRGCDSESDDQIAATRKAVADLGLDPARHAVEVTGAWHDPSGRSGCVTSVAQELSRLGFDVLVREDAVVEPDTSPGPAPG
jgi:hypothetical protein